MFPDSLSHIGPHVPANKKRLPKVRRTILLRNGAGEYAFVSCGFSWPAFFLGDLWLIVKGMWWYLVPIGAIEIGVWMCSGYAEGRNNMPLLTAACIANVCYAILRGEYSNRWHLASMLDRGFKPVNEIDLAN